jgi:hypothetical protein
MTQTEKARAAAKANSKTYHLISTENKNQTMCGKSIQVGDGKPQVLLSSTPSKVVGKICPRCQNPNGAAAVKKAATGERVPSAKIPAGKIHVLAEKNPRREGTRAHKQFALYKNGQTPAEFLAAGGTGGDLRWDLKRKHIEIK